MTRITFNEWMLRLHSPHYANNIEMYNAYMAVNEPPRLKISSFKQRSQEIKDKYNHKF